MTFVQNKPNRSRPSSSSIFTAKQTRLGCLKLFQILKSILKSKVTNSNHLLPTAKVIEEIKWTLLNSNSFWQSSFVKQFLGFSEELTGEWESMLIHLEETVIRWNYFWKWKTALAGNKSVWNNSRKPPCFSFKIWMRLPKSSYIC